MDYDKAMAAINTAIKLAPNNPELKYYKAQLLAIRGRARQAPSGDGELRESIKLFDVAYQRHDKLLTSTVIQVMSERCQAKSALNRTDTSKCGIDEAKVKRDNPNVIVGPSKVPPLS